MKNDKYGLQRKKDYPNTSMHPSRMCTARLLTVSRSIREGGFLPGGGVCLRGSAGRGVVSTQGVSAQGWLSQHAMDRDPPPVKRMTDRCKNITLPKLHLRAVTSYFSVTHIIPWSAYHCITHRTEAETVKCQHSNKLRLPEWQNARPFSLFHNEQNLKEMKLFRFFASRCILRVTEKQCCSSEILWKQWKFRFSEIPFEFFKSFVQRCIEPFYTKEKCIPKNAQLLLTNKNAENFGDLISFLHVPNCQ